jgi:hypothetical protein
MTDEIIRELWRVKDEFATKFNYNIAALAAEIRRRDRESREEVVDLSRRNAEQQTGRNETQT